MKFYNIYSYIYRENFFFKYVLEYIKKNKI